MKDGCPGYYYQGILYLTEKEMTMATFIPTTKDDLPYTVHFTSDKGPTVYSYATIGEAFDEAHKQSNQYGEARIVHLIGTVKKL